MTNEKLTEMHAVWAHILSEYEFEIKHRPVKRSGDADGLSKNPLQNETDLTDARMDHEPSLVSHDFHVCRVNAIGVPRGRDQR
jgi:hypothetical protein